MDIKNSFFYSFYSEGTGWIDDKGIKHGTEIARYSNGQKCWEVMRTNGIKHGMTTSWYISGKNLKEVYYLHGKEYAHIEWNEEGNVAKTDLPILTTNANAKPKNITTNNK